MVPSRGKKVRPLAKNSMETIRADSKKVLNILEQNAKESIDVIAKKCGFSSQKVWRIIKYLEQENLIWGYTIIADEKGKDLKHFVLLLKRTIVPIDDAMQNEVITEKLDRYLPKLVQIEDIIITHGKYDAVVMFYAPNLITAKKVIEALSQRIGKYFQEYLLLETLFPIRKQGLKNPDLKNLAKYI
jgi:DNA-binding Lrp family transcriptional regulator